MEKIKDFKQLALRDFVYISWEYKSYKGDNSIDIASRNEWLLGKVVKLDSKNKEYPAEVVALSCSGGALVEIGKMVFLTKTILKHTNTKELSSLGFRCKEFNKLTSGEAAVHLI